jgi:hypothetical protein
MFAAPSAMRTYLGRGRSGWVLLIAATQVNNTLVTTVWSTTVIIVYVLVTAHIAKKIYVTIVKPWIGARVVMPSFA